MYDDIKLAVIGGDRRLSAAAEAAAADGFECAVWGNSICYGGVVRCTSPEDALRGASVVILPLPLSQDGVRLFAPDSIEGGDLRLTKLVEAIPQNAKVYGGKIPCDIMCMLRGREISFKDYYEEEAFKIKNAYQTAEGAIGIAIKELPVTLFGSRALVVGYGRVGRATAELLKKMGVKVTVAARRESDLADAICRGMNIYNDSRGLEGISSEYDCIFNTVPVRLFTDKVLHSLSGTLFVELASSPFGADASSAEAAGVKMIRAISLPGKTCPVSAGVSIYETVVSNMKKEGVII
ncbi:MAG: hypothetical protein IKT70_09155 [Clostridia bacterium]|nr:hypothetical protein [Clostridia bacterium]